MEQIKHYKNVLATEGYKTLAIYEFFFGVNSPIHNEYNLESSCNWLIKETWKPVSVASHLPLHLGMSIRMYALGIEI